MILKSELGETWKEMAVANLKVIFKHLHGKTEEKHEKP
jgi:hypothetical protein